VYKFELNTKYTLLCYTLVSILSNGVIAMALKPKMANSLKVDNEGYAHGEIVDITELDGSESNLDKEQYLFDFVCEGTIKPINIKYWTGVLINSERYGEGKNKEYNKLTKLCIKLGLITVDDLKSGKEIDIDLDILKSKQIKFKPVKTSKSSNLTTIDIETLVIVASNEVTQSK
jgi:hypothetical protein